MLTKITPKMVEEYRNHRRQQPSIRYKRLQSRCSGPASFVVKRNRKRKDYTNEGTSRQPAVPKLSAISSRGFKKTFIPIYPNTLPTVPKPSRASRTASLVVSNLPASQSAITRLENR